MPLPQPFVYGEAIRVQVDLRMAALSGDADLSDDAKAPRLEQYLLGQMPDARRHRRIFISLPVRFMLAEGSEHRGLLFDMSPGGLSVTSELIPPIDMRIVLYIDDIGRVEGVVARHHPYGFAVHLATTQTRRDKIAERLIFHANSHRLRADDLRAHERTETDHRTRCVLPDGSALNCRVLDLSLTGAAIEITPAPEIGTEIVIGRMQGRVVRLIENGVAVRFLDAGSSQASMQSRLTRLWTGSETTQES